jgi:signal transduction histidine kinase
VTLAARLLLTFGLVAIFATALVGLSLREVSRELIESDFTSRMDASAESVRQELIREAEELRDLLEPLCEHDTFVDKALLDLDKAKGDVDKLDAGTRIAMRHFVPDQARALRLDELALLTSGGVVLGAEDATRIGTRDARLAALLKTPRHRSVRVRPAVAGGDPLMEAHCARTSYGVTVGLVGGRRIGKLLDRVGKAYGVSLAVADPSKPPAESNADYAVKALELAEVSDLRVVAAVPRDTLKRALAKLDRSIEITGAVALVLALGIAAALARSLSRPIVALARETREVLSGEPRLVKGRGGKEIAELAGAFNHTIDELTRMRRRLAAIERIAARREVARQIAHEIKNPLAPIRAAVETLRRLRARDDPAFDEYFEEATATVLTEVHRIANIVTEFTKFARLPPPNPEPIDLASVARGVVTLHNAVPGSLGAERSSSSEPPASGESASGEGAKEARVELVAEPIPMVSADRDQVVQVLTNLVQNGLDAAGAVRDDPRVVVTLGPLPNDRVRIVVRDNGPGVAEEMLPRLFEPYATSKEKGTGLGLAIVQRIVFEHGGEIAYRKATKGGAVFEFWLPVSGPPLLEKPPALDATERR